MRYVALVRGMHSHSHASPPPPFQRGRLKCVKALGWYLEEHDMAQISMNLTDFETTPLHVAFQECCKDARVCVINFVTLVLYPQPFLMHLSVMALYLRSHVHTHIPVPESRSGWIRDRGTGAPEGNAHGCRVLHPARKPLHSARAPEAATGRPETRVKRPH